MTSKQPVDLKALHRALAKGDGVPKAAPLPRQAPLTEEPADDDVVTRELPLKAPAPAASPRAKPRSHDDTRTTVEVDMSEAAAEEKAKSDVPPPPAIVQLPAPKAPAPRVVKPVAAAPKGRIAPPEETEKPAEKPPEVSQIVAEVLKQLKPHLAEEIKPLIAELEQGLGARITAAEEAARGASAQVDAVVEEIVGNSELDGDVADADGSDRRPSLRKALKQVSETADSAAKTADKAAAQVNSVVEEIEGNPKLDYDVTDADGSDRRPSLRKLLRDIQGLGEQAQSVLRGLLGPDFEGLHSIVISRDIQARKVLVSLLREDNYLELVRKSAVEVGPVFVRKILTAFVTPDSETEAVPVYGVMKLSLAQDQNSSIEKLGKDPKLAKWVEENTPELVRRAEECLTGIDWEACSAENRRMIFGGDE